jgi:superfamily II DNA or RNA helicase
MLPDLRIVQVDNVWARVDCEPSIAQELCDFFTFEDPGAKFSPAVKARHWDGKTRLFSVKTHKIYAGLIKYIIEFAKVNNYSATYALLPNNYGKPDAEFLNHLKLPVTPHDYQVAAFEHAIAVGRSVIISPTASGKSLMIYTIARYLLARNKKCGLLVVPTISLVEQMYSDFKDYGWDVEKNCQKIYQGQTKEPTAKLVISTWQSIYEMPRAYFKKFDFVIGDEAHTFKASSLRDIMTKLVNCDYRIGTTGTLDGTKINKLILEGLFGPVRKIVATKDLMDRGLLAQLDIRCCVLTYPPEECQHVKGMEYKDEIDFIVGHERRNKFIRNLVEYLDGNTLILYTYVDKHGRVLDKLIRDKITDRKIFFVCGLTDVESREEVRHLTEKETNAIIIASYGTFSTGINIRNLHNVVFASPTKSQIRTLQSIGRGLRLGDNKTKAVLFDIADDLRYKNYVNFTLKHYEERVKIYNSERFTLKSKNIGI